MIECDYLWLIWWYWMSENEWKLFVERWNWIWQSFLSFLFCNDENKQGMKWNFNFIRFVFHFCSVWWLLAILAKRNQSSFFLDCDLRKRDFDQIDRNDRNLNRICKECFEFVLFCFFFLIWGLLKRRNYGVTLDPTPVPQPNIFKLLMPDNEELVGTLYVCYSIGMVCSLF